ncbi:1362_t:CDS:2 [Diversispora eburnea]|uniref:1362_t:CDS:1 n=1 Tax=Diversispora eburnea TaxID=1213867 RepID=A0A9N8YIM9_9GLOM|nr:1362_t:CDS:2 [Diversispora eburnea]
MTKLFNDSDSHFVEKCTLSYLTRSSSTISTISTSSHIPSSSTASTVVTFHMQSVPLRLSKDHLNQARDRLLAYQEEKYESKDLIVGPNSYYTADLTQDFPKAPIDQGSNSKGNAYPTLIFEVGNSNDGTMAMFALHYLHTNRNNTVPDIIIYFGTALLHPLTINFLMKVVGVSPVTITDFGYSATTCNAPNIPDYQLHNPTIELFNVSPGGFPAGAINVPSCPIGNKDIEINREEYGLASGECDVSPKGKASQQYIITIADDEEELELL